MSTPETPECKHEFTHATEKLDKCVICDERKPDVSTRPDGYRQDVNNEDGAVYTVCDACNHECLMDI